MSVPAPRAFALHKLWLSNQVNRETIEKQRDYDQAIAIASLGVNYLPQFESKAAGLLMFPKEIFADVRSENMNGSRACLARWSRLITDKHL
jgi:hypothetical protein